MAKCVGALLTTLIMIGLLFIVEIALSAAIIVVLVIAFRVAGKVPVPFVKVVLAGSTAWASLLEKCTMPE
jgi:hypothetical protein